MSTPPWGQENGEHPPQPAQSPPAVWPPPPTLSYQPNVPIQYRPPFRPIHTLKVLAMVFLGIYLVMSVGAAIMELIQAVAGPAANAARINNVFDNIQSVSFFPCALVFLLWLYRVCANAPALGASGLTISPGWAVGYFFIPILSFFRPLQAVCEVWKASDPGLDLSADLSAWRNGKVAPIVGWWWAIWLVSNIAGLALTITAIGSEGTRASEAESCIADSLTIASCITALLLVRALSARQEEKKRILTSLVSGR